MTDSVGEVIKAGKALDEASEKITGDKPVEKVVVRGPGLLLTVAQNVQYVLTTVAATLVLLFFLLASGSFFHLRLVELFDRLGDKKRALSVLLGAESDVSRYILSISAINLALGAAVAGALALAGLPDPVSWGLMATLLNFIPYVGGLIGIVMVAAASVLEFYTVEQMLVGPGAYLLLTLLEGQFVTPMVLGRRFDVNPAVILVAVAFWGWIWGIVGAIVAVPLLVAVKVICTQSGVAPLFVHFISSHVSEDQPGPGVQPGPEIGPQTEPASRSETDRT
ncbi:MAG: AI-2E family transporter [Burkholderiaceae bacterium]